MTRADIFSSGGWQGSIIDLALDNISVTHSWSRSDYSLE
jgi:hypothetical protein